MPPLRPILPDDVLESGYVYISVGLDPRGEIVTDVAYDGMSIAQAIGELVSASDVLRDENRTAWLEITEEELINES